VTLFTAPLELVYWIVVVPGETAVITPVKAFTVATDGLLDDQILVPGSVVVAVLVIVSPICKTVADVPTPVIACPLFPANPKTGFCTDQHRAGAFQRTRRSINTKEGLLS